ncbi:peptidase M16 [Sporanaerobium hydrogeniformans]|uniref:Peptidase M16 n=1 Tax=Sporanaerobium hydrogeniformans TaxID=3072179 RepID=A0AC61DFU5_9FIRM|nr:insulinase family protein [Sporanaerobium hydrogeniformans]PHV71817.1 peptidase M16 [Sporanaerobium hydrogeniformans]
MTETIKGYTLVESQYIKEIDSQVDCYSHDKTKAHILVIANEDVHKSFCIGFRTPPHDSTGVAHIIEHSVLCGSRKYPLKDPFVELAKGSLNTYLNAMTYPDKTLYPISSQNDKDFHNLMDVYLDAVFFPNIYKSKEIVMQEGWRYHLEKEDDPIEYKGVVYNEMKGAFSSPEEIAFRFIKSSLFPDTIYKNESGGAPSDIPDLSYEELLAFHKTHYHPSNSYICLYGNSHTEKTLRYIDEEYLSHFNYESPQSCIQLQQPLGEVKTHKAFYSAAEGKENGLFLSCNFVVGEMTNRELMLGMNVLEYLLLDTPAAPLKKALIAEGIGEDVYGMFQTHLKQPIFSIVAKNVIPEKRERFYSLIKETLEKLVKEGIPKALISGALQVKEFELREGDSSGYSKGLFYSIAAIKSWIYEASPFVYLKFEKELEILKEGIQTGYFEDLIKTYLLNSQHCTQVELYPKVGLEKEIEEKTTQKLAAYKMQLTSEAIKQLVEETKAFNAFQERVDSEEALHTIPLLTKEDLRREVSYPRYKVIKKGTTEYIVTPVFTNQIVYMNWYLHLEDIEDGKMPYLGMIVGMLGKLSTKNYSYEALSTTIDEHLGGMEYHIQAISHPDSLEKYLPVFLFKSKALIGKVKEQVDLMKEILCETLFEDKNRLLEIIREMKAIMESSLSGEGHRVAYSRLLSHFTGAELFEEKTKGLTFYHFVCEIEKEWQLRQDEVVIALQEAYQLLSNKARLIVGLTVDEDQVVKVIKEIERGIEDLKYEALIPLKMHFEQSNCQEALVYPTNVNYVAMGYNFKALGYAYHGSLMMLKSLLSMDYLWNKVRVQNGAYGCFCDFRRSGNMFFVSYRDPYVKETLATYKKVSTYLKNIQLTERELLQYLIGTISHLDFPFTSASEGKTAQVYHLMGIQKATLQKARDELFATDNRVLQGFASLLEDCMAKNMYCIFANSHTVEETKTLYQDITSV